MRDGSWQFWLAMAGAALFGCGLAYTFKVIVSRLRDRRWERYRAEADRARVRVVLPLRCCHMAFGGAVVSASCSICGPLEAS